MGTVDTSGRGDPQRKLELELEDLSLVFGVLCDDPGEGLKYLNLESRQTNQSIPERVLRETVRYFDVCLERGAPFFVGGSGIVVRCANPKVRDLKYALKIPRPSLFDDATLTGREKHRAELEEYLKHAPLLHENIARVLQTGKITVPDRDGAKLEHDAMLMEWIDGAQPLLKYLASARPRFQDIVRLLIQSFEALTYVHNNRLVHWDVKSDNLLVSGARVLKLTDIGNARSMDGSDSPFAYSTLGNPPPSLDRFTHYNPENAHGSKRVQIRVPEGWDSSFVDLWMFARQLNRFVGAARELLESDRDLSIVEGETLWDTRTAFLAASFPDEDDDAVYALRYVRLVLQRLLQPAKPSDTRYYGNGHEVAEHLSNLLTELGASQPIPELQGIPQRVLRLPQSGNLAWTHRLGRLVNEPIVRRLRQHRQLAAVSQVYPGATHTRFEHSVGVVARTATFVRALYADRTDPFWRLEAREIDVKALLLAALLHDCGHVAYGHFLEEMGGLLRGRTHEDYAILVLDPHGASSDPRRTVRFAAETARMATEDRAQLKAVIIEDWGLLEPEADSFLKEVALILRLPPSQGAVSRWESQLEPEGSRQLKLEILHSILDSAMDADKLDYLLRDSHHCGVRYPDGIDLDRYFQSLTTVPYLPRVPELESEARDPAQATVPRAATGVTGKGVLPVESALIARYQMFSCVYWHHTTRAHTAMLQYLVLRYLDVGDDPSTVEGRLDELLDHFRISSDEDAVEWLKSRLLAALDPGAATYELISGVADGVLGRGREHLYRRAFELRYERRPGGHARGLAASLSAMADRANGETPHGYVSYARSLRSRFAAFLQDRLGASIAVLDGEVLVDVPPAGKDQVRDIYVVDRGSVFAIQEMSSVANAVAEAFRYWVRKARVFISPSLAKRLADRGLDRGRVWDACWNALTDLTQVQGELFPLSAGDSTERYT